MKTIESRSELTFRAAEALKSVLSEVSTIKLKELRCHPASSGDIGIVARVDVFGHSHTLACDVQANGQPGLLPSVLLQLQASTDELQSGATPILIAPYLSPEAQALCKQSNAGFLDLTGNARISLGEVFIGKRTLAYRTSDRPPAFAAETSSMPARTNPSQERSKSLRPVSVGRTCERSFPAPAMV